MFCIIVLQSYWTVNAREYPSDGGWFSLEVHDCQQLYSLDVLGIEDRGENSQLEVHKEVKKNIVRNEDG